MRCLIQQLTDQANRFFMAVLTIAVVFSLVLVAGSSWNIWTISRGFEPEITKIVQLQRLSGAIIHLDEVLTMSARMAAATGDLKWESRYNRFEPELDEAIKTAIALAPESYADHAMQTDAANLELVAMELKSFDLVRHGQTADAMAILFSSAYDTQKQIYAEGIDKTTAALRDNLQSRLEDYNHTFTQSSLFSLISFPILAGSWLIILALVRNYIQRQRQSERRLRSAKQALQQSNSRLQDSELALRQKASVLEETLHTLQQTQVKMIQSEKMSSLGLLVAGIAHEINNPVNFIHGNLEYLDEKARELLKIIDLYEQYCPNPGGELQQQVAALDLDFLRTDWSKLLTSIYVGTERIQQIVLSLHNFSRSDESECKWVDIHEGIDSTLMILQHRLKSSPDSPEINVVKQYSNLPLVECYVGPLNQVFMNLLSNAVDAIYDAHRCMTQIRENQYAAVPLEQAVPLSQVRAYQIRIETRIVEGDWVEIAIADNGIGMTESVRHKIFEPFFTTKPVGKGTGMGIPISYQIVVERHGGLLECISVPNQGSKFLIRIPPNQSQASFLSA